MLLEYSTLLQFKVAMVQLTRAFASHAEGWVFKCWKRQIFIEVDKTGRDGSTVKHRTTGVNIKDPKNGCLMLQ